MSFAVSELQSDGFDLVVLEDHDSRLSIAILPAYGALLHAVMLETGNGTVNIIDNYESLASLQTELNRSYKGCKLSPFVCRIAGGEYAYDGRQLSFLERHYDHSAIHGLLYNKQFTIEDLAATDKEASLRCSYHYKKEDPGYPFEYKCAVRYTLLPGNLVRVDTTVTNMDDVAIPLADGWHPYFKLGGLVDDWLLQFRAASMIELNDRLVPTGKLLPYTGFHQEKAIGAVEFDDCFLLDRQENTAACSLINPVSKSGIVFFPSNAYPYLQFYIPPSRESIAVENLSAAPDSFNNKMGLELLDAGQNKCYRLYYQFITEKNLHAAPYNMNFEF